LETIPQPSSSINQKSKTWLEKTMADYADIRRILADFEKRLNELEAATLTEV